jgi:cellulose synthase/poly-beta-1,6-N-acetylglucosamine synthase-like glycosyltransferase/peptidoglycan/xylan/chitin deacetylase (PgdA/CDA1 family)/spore germination protein YaaH
LAFRWPHDYFEARKFSLTLKEDNFIFHDHRGRRWPAFKFLAVLGSLLAAVALLVFFWSLFAPPPIDQPDSFEAVRGQLHAFARNPSPAMAAGDRVLSRLRAGLRSAKQPAPTPSKNLPPIVAGFVAGHDKASLESLKKNKNLVTHVCPEWLTFTNPSGEIAEEQDSVIEELASSGKWKVMPVLSNLLGDERIPEAVEALAIADESTQQAFAEKLAKKLSDVGAAGVLIDWQEVEQGNEQEMGKLVSFLADELRRNGLQTWLCIEPDGAFPLWDFQTLAANVDHFVVLLHEETGYTDPAGPIVSLDWFQSWVDVIAQSASPAKWVVGIGVYGHDRAEGKIEAEEISFADAVSRAGNAGCESVGSTTPSFNASFSYYFAGRAHEVWFPDAATFANQWNAVQTAKLGGIAINRLGFEDPSIWQIIASGEKTNSSALGNEIAGGYAVTSIGAGEVVNLDPTSFAGRRTFSQDAEGRISSTYVEFPAHPTLFRMGGYQSNRVSITFDDGPDPDWTPAILGILKERGVKAVFFVIGKNAELYPDLLRRIADEGHEIGNHSFTHANLRELPESLVNLELNATQRLIESLIGRSTALFRPPFNADAHPSDVEDLKPIRMAQTLGYMTVLENIDPCDWQEPPPEELLQRVKDKRGEGNIILLHDSGGDRSSTVAALPMILDYLKERGDEVVPIGELVAIDREGIMPPVRSNSHPVAFFASGAGFSFLRVLQAAFFGFLIVASVLVLLRTLIVVVLALRHRSKSSPISNPISPISILIPAFNEEKVITRTVRSMLASDYAGPMEILVVDDGSSDRTAELVEAIGDLRVRLIRQQNLGKARALQNAVSHAKSEILVFADADTQFEREALRHLVGALQDEKTGAVSGQARVGNPRTFAARCQEIEYLCNFNLDRRAYAAWNCITVVPGAISAIKREALDAAGGISLDTLAEDTDLTLAIHRAGYRVEYAPQAIALTEAPETFAQLARQRFRWAFGTIQCVWKHRDLVFNPRFKALGWFSLPSIWFFQVLLVALAPIIDLLFLQSLLLGHGSDILPYFLGFLLCDMALAAVAVKLEGLPARLALRIIPQRFLYRPLLSWVIWKSLLQAMRGAWVGWGKLPRTAAVPATI